MTENSVVLYKDSCTKLAEILTPTPSYEQIKALEDFINLIPGVITDYPTTHRFCDGLYSREIEIPEDMIIVGKMHIRENFLVILEGDMTVWTETGMKRLNTPQILLTKPGTKRVFYAHKYSRIATFHGIYADTKEEVESQLFAVNEREFLNLLEGGLKGYLEHSNE